jgi:hypothetical protein
LGGIPQLYGQRKSLWAIKRVVLSVVSQILLILELFIYFVYLLRISCNNNNQNNSHHMHPTGTSSNTTTTKTQQQQQLHSKRYPSSSLFARSNVMLKHQQQRHQDDIQPSNINTTMVP